MKLLEVYREYMKLWDQHEDPVCMLGMSDRGIHMSAWDALTFKQWLENRGGAITGYYLEDDTIWLYGKLEDVQLYTILTGNEVNIDLRTIREFKKWGGVVSND